ncbi:unnamed protein product [Alternaria alternata]
MAPLLALPQSLDPPELANILPFQHTSSRDHDRDGPAPLFEYRTSLQLRQEQADAFYRTQHNRSRASSSTGSVANSLRRTPNFERARSVDPSQQQRVRFETPRPHSTPYAEPHPALRISRRTASAIRFVLEEGLRLPHPFTPDLVEENALMSDLSSGRAANGGARTTGGPVPVDRSNIRTPTQIMNARRQRAEVEEQRKAAEEERRRASAERRAQAVSGVAGAPTTEPGTQRQPQSAPLRSGDQYVQYPTSSGGVPRQPERPIPSQNTMNEAQETTTGASQSRPRAASQTPSRPTQANLGLPTTAEQSRRPAGSGHARRPSGATASSQAGPQLLQHDHRLRRRELRLEAEANMERMATEKKNAERAVSEMKRELQISKEEARRAWEELGRREQEERDRTFSLREGQPTLVGGVQVVPMAQNMGRQGRGHGDDTYAGAQSSGEGIEQHYSYEEGQSPTDTDPFTESARHGRREPEQPAHVAQGTYIPSGAASTASSRPGGSSVADESLAPAPLQYPYYTSQAQQGSTQPAMSQPEAFYQQPASYLHQESESGLPDDEQSYVTSQAESEADIEYALDERGNFIRDDSGRRIPFRSLQSPVSDEYDVEDARRRELEHLQHYGTTATSQGGYATSSGAGSSQQPVGGRPDYSGDGYGDEWVGMRHHHPTRLSDVPEEDERSRTSPSRASQASRGRLY